MISQHSLQADIDAVVEQANEVQPLTGELALAVAFWVHGQRMIIEASNSETSQLLRDLALRPALESLLRANAIARDPETVVAIAGGSLGPRGRGRWFGKNGFLRTDEDRHEAHQGSLRDWSEALGVDDVGRIAFSEDLLRVGIGDDLWLAIESARQQLSHLQIHPSIDALRIYFDDGDPPRLTATQTPPPLAQDTVATLGEVANLARAAVIRLIRESST